MKTADYAAALLRFADRVRDLPGVSRTNPHAFLEAKDELAEAMAREARAWLGTGQPSAHDAGDAKAMALAPIRPGTRVIDGRTVTVQVRPADQRKRG